MITLKAYAAAGLTATALFASAASHAQGMATQVGGEFYQSTCGFIANDVHLGQHEARSFTGVGSSTDWQTFTIRSTGCAADLTHVFMTYHATADADVPELFAFTGFTGVALEMFTGAGSRPNVKIVPGGSIGWGARGSGEGWLHFVRLVQTTPAVNTGIGRIPITVTVSYR